MMQWPKRFATDVAAVQWDSVRFARAMPLALLAMVLIEMVQHVVEVKLGFFGPTAQRRAVAFDPARVGLGVVKMMTLYGVGFLATRYFWFADANRARGVTAADLRRFLSVFVYQMAMFGLIFFGTFALQRMDRPPLAPQTFQAVIGLGQIALEPLLFVWFVGAATGDWRVGPVRSARLTGLLYLWTLPLFFVARLPSGALHQYLNRWAATLDPAPMWGLLILDSLLVGLLAAIVPAIHVRAIRPIIERRALATSSSPGVSPRETVGEGGSRA